nr:retrovirus-related Pol polyprotein from transposon TNT 1-94 [Tanacetum cinerariifolium]
SCLDSRKSTSGGIQFLGGDKLVSWSSKKQDCTSMSFTKAEYVSLSACCAQVLWMRTQLIDYGFHFDKIPLYCDSKAAISISCNPVQHSRTKHIDVRYYFKKEKVKNDQNSSDPVPKCHKMALEHDSSSPGRKCQTNVSQSDRTVTTSNELDLLFSPMFDELLNGSSKVVSKPSAVSAADVSNQQLNAENDQVADDEFINIFSTSVQEQGETSSRHVDSSNMHTFYQRYLSKHRWTKDHPLEQVVSNSFAVTTADAPNQHQQQHITPLNNQTTPDPTCQVPTQAQSVTSTEKINQAEMIVENAQVENDEFINIFCTPVQGRGETSSRHVDSSNMHTFYEHHPFEHRWTKDHP